MKKEYLSRFVGNCVKWNVVLTLLVFSLFMAAESGAFTLNVVGSDGGPVGSYRWLVEEDATYHVVPNTPDPDTLSVSFHSSYMPVVAKGTSTDALPALDTGKHYFVSVLPDSGYTIGGAPLAGDGAVTVYVNKLPLPTAQITIFVFEDNFPINNAPDLPEELGLEGFQIVVEDAGGRYGMSAGTMMQDAFGNMLGTVYERDAAGNFILDADGNPIIALDRRGDPIVNPLVTDANGELTIKNLSPGKYGVIAIPPAGEGWVQTSTIEGTKVIDAWVKANEPPFFAEFGPPGYHAFIGFVRPMYDATVLTGGSTISGQVVNLHLSRPPDYAFYNGAPLEHTTPWVGLNLGAGGRGVYAAQTGPNGSFSIPNVPPGTYQLVVWDDALDIIFAFHQVTVPPGGGNIVLGDVPVFQWFTRLENWVFNDLNENGFWDTGEMSIAEQNINIRWRDGTMYQSAPTDGEGFVPFDQVFPFFSWLVAEVDFARYKATGVTVVVDDGGAINPTDPWTFGGQLNPQPQSENSDLPYRTETGPVLSQAFQGFLGQTSVLQWGKTAYGPGENGGISGIVYYASTRAEDDPAKAAAEPWEPGIPRVQVNLYQDSNGDGVIDDLNDPPDGIQHADVDNYPFGNFPGDEDIDWNIDTLFDFGDALQVTWTDSWDDSQPTGCQGDPFVYLGDTKDCFDGLRNFNQVRPGVFDGGYAFDGLAAGIYIVEASPPPGYELVKEEDKNVDFGDQYVPSLMLIAPSCVGDDHLVPDELSLFPGVPAYYAGQTRPLCDRKQVFLGDGLNAAADFFLFTEVPIAGHIIGFILDDTANEFDITAPTFGEKFAPPWLPVSIRDWTGREISRTYSDQYGVYNALVPSTYTADRPAPSGMSPNMLTTCMNDPRLPDGTEDPNFNPQYSTFCYTFQYMPGATTYLDTPVIPVAAFAGPNQSPLDCEPIDGTPVIYSASVTGNGVGGGPYAPAAGMSITIQSQRDITGKCAPDLVEVPNPAFDGIGVIPGNERTICRDYSFGPDQGEVTIGGIPLMTISSWTPESITGTIAAGTTTGELVVTRGDNEKSTIVGVTVAIGLKTGQSVVSVSPSGDPDATQIQNAIDAAGTNDLILVAPGTYNEMVVMWKPVQLQGWGAGSTTIDAVKSPPEKLVEWRALVQSLIESNSVDILPAQEVGFGGIEPVTLFAEEGAGVLVLAKSTGNRRFNQANNRGARIDGFSIRGADTGGGIIVNGYGYYLEISNNRITNNSGFYGGGIRVGHPELVLEQGNNLLYQDGMNDYIRIHHNHIAQNGGLGGAGGGVSLCNGSDSYQVSGNFICGNLSLGDGGGIGHLGLSDNGLISGNTILFNESFNQGVNVYGGGVFIGGLAPIPANALSPGAGSVKVNGNLIQGNLAGAGDGGGIQLSRINGQDVAANRNRPERWYTVNLFNNMVVNNVAALAAGGISLSDAARVNILHNTVANNDSTATAGDAFSPGSPNQSNPQPAGIVSRAHSPGLTAASNNAGTFSNPQLVDNIIWHNRSFYFFGDPAADPPVYRLMPDMSLDPLPAPVFDDLAVLGTATPQLLNPLYSILTDTTGYDGSNITADPLFLAEYFNGNRDETIANPEGTTALQVPPAFDEGGNFIRVRFGPLTQTRVDTGDLYGNYHIQSGLLAPNGGLDLTGTYSDLLTDFDGQPRPNGETDRGADEYWP